VRRVSFNAADSPEEEAAPEMPGREMTGVVAFSTEVEQPDESELDEMFDDGDDDDYADEIPELKEATG
jgi:hypothetical protein